jgi:hypothetical protein
MLRLDEAMILGTTLGRQIFMRLRWSNGRDRGSCALGSAMDATGIKRLAKLRRTYPILLEFSTTCPACKVDEDGMVAQGFTTLELLIIHLNDYHRWSRERIAYFVGRCQKRYFRQFTLELGREARRILKKRKAEDEKMIKANV